MMLLQIDPTFHGPLRALFLTASVCLLISLIQIASTTAFNAILSLQTLALTISYLLPTLFLAIKRVRGQSLPRGPFNLGKRFGLLLNLFGVVYAIYIIIFLPFPPILPVTGSNMNYSGVVVGIVLIWALSDWILNGRKRWTGPKGRFGDSSATKEQVE
jgi:choline transport protein